MLVLPGSMVVFGAIWIFPMKISSHSERLTKYLRHEPLFSGNVVAYSIYCISYVLLSDKAMGDEAFIN